MSSNRPFVCNACSQTFTRNENLERHRRSSGDDQPPHPELEQDPAYLSEAVSPPNPPPTSSSPHVILGSPVTASVEGQPPSPVGTRTRPALSEPSPGSTAYVLNPSSLFSSTRKPASSLNRICCLRTGSRSTDSYIAAYFEYFHPSFPLLHRPTVGEDTPEVLRNIIVAIGSLYTAQKLSEKDAESCVRLSQKLWDAGRKSLALLVGSDWRELRRTWAMQAWLLHIIYGAFMGDASQYNNVKKMLRTVVDAAQDLGLLRQNVATSASQSWLRACDTVPDGGDAQTLHNLWMLYVNEESMKLSMYTLLFLDFHISAPCNARLLTSPLDLDWELPLSIALWEAGTAVAWCERLSQEPRIHALLKPNEAIGLPCPNTRSLTLATQSLMSDSPSPHLMEALAASPIATLFLLTNIDAFVRDFTRCYYQLPPGLADPSAFHIFTQSQNRQISAALRQISRTVGERDPERDGSNLYRPIWRAIECMALAIKISLCKPDDLLIGGIVDSSVVAGLATATHLTLGRYAGARRSLESLMQHNSGDDAVLMVLDEAMCLLSSIFGSGRQDALCEPPWATTASYRIILAIWRSLRWSAAEMRSRSGEEAQIRRRFEASTVIFHAIMEVVMEQQEALGQDAGQDAGQNSGTEGFGSLLGQDAGQNSGMEGLDALLAASPEVAEARFTKAVLSFWKKRSVWAVGTSMATVLEEIISDEL